MFVFSIKADRRKIILVLAAVLLVVTGALVLSRMHRSAANAETGGMKYSLSAATNEERVAFFAQFGWTVDPEPLESKDVMIPQEFSDVYENYNRIQKGQGLDLSPFCGKTCKQWVYAVTNYPENADVRASILVYDNRVIGGDLSTAALDGFMTGFSGEQLSNDGQLPASSGAASKGASSGAASKGASSGAASKAASSGAASKGASSAAPSKGGSKKSSAPSAQETKPKASSAVPTNAWPTD